jgi:hypothetical protein
MKKLLNLLSICLPYLLHAQFVVTSGTNGITIKAFATVSIDSLIMSPSSDVMISNNQLTRSSTNQAIGAGNSIDRVYSFSSPITYSGNIGFKYNDAEMAGNTEAALDIAYAASGSGSVWITTTGSSLNTAANTIVQNLSNATIARLTATSAGPLPVTLVEFTAKKDEQGQAALLQWEVANEQSFDKYNVEHGIDGKTFAKLGEVKATGASNYQFTDSNPETGINFYRLQMQNLDGSYHYSPVRSLVFENDKTAINVFPNPVKEETVTIHSTDKALDGKNGSVTDISGKVILSFKITGDNTYIDANNWLAGIYLIRLENGMTFKIVKQ